MSERVKAIVSAAVVIAVEVAGICGVTLDSDTVTQVVSTVVIIAVTVYGIWKNHNFTGAAAAAQALLDGIKAGVDMTAEADDRKGDGDEGVA